jgi:hypothetical protein
VADWQVVFETDADNVRAALRWLIDSGQVASAQQLGSMLARSWQMGNSLDEGRGWLAELLRLPVADPATRAQVLLADGLLAIYQADFVAARAHLEKAHHLCGRLATRWEWPRRCLRSAHHRALELLNVFVGAVRWCPRCGRLHRRPLTGR